MCLANMMKSSWSTNACIAGSRIDVGFILRAGIIKIHHKMKSTREEWRGTKYDFYLLGHEHLYVFRKPANGEKMSEFKNSVKWR